MISKKQRWFYDHNSMDYGLLLKNGDDREHENHRLFTTDKFQNILEAWEATSYYPQTSCGLNHTRRDVVVADYDGDCASFIQSFSGKIPPSYILINPDSNHVQAGWLLDEPYDFENPVDKETFLTIKRCINRLCPDCGFTGWQIKNPFYDGFIPYHFLMNSYSKSVIESNFCIKERVIKLNKSKKRVVPSLNLLDNKETQLEPDKIRRYAGRNNLSLYYGIRFVSKCKTAEIECDVNTTFEFLKRKQSEICTQVGKSEPLPDKEILTCARHAFDYVEQNYNPILAKNGKFGDQARKASLITRRANAEARAEVTWQYHLQGESLRSIAQIMGIGKNTVAKDIAFMKAKTAESDTLHYFQN